MTPATSPRPQRCYKRAFWTNPRVGLDRASMTKQEVPVCPHERYVDVLRQNPHWIGNEQTGAALCASSPSLPGRGAAGEWT